MGRPRDEVIPHRREKRQPGPPLVTLQQLRKGSCWWWLVCGGCMHFQPIAIVPLIIRWGPLEEVDRLRRSARCGICGHKGATLSMPSWMGSIVGQMPWPERFNAPAPVWPRRLKNP
jgi:hypothetical protein